MHHELVLAAGAQWLQRLTVGGDAPKLDASKALQRITGSASASGPWTLPRAMHTGHLPVTEPYSGLVRRMHSGCTY